MIHESSIVSPKAKIGKNVRIGHFSVVHDDVIIGDNTIIEGGCNTKKLKNFHKRLNSAIAYI